MNLQSLEQENIHERGRVGYNWVQMIYVDTKSQMHLHKYKIYQYCNTKHCKCINLSGERTNEDTFLC